MNQTKHNINAVSAARIGRYARARLALAQARESAHDPRSGNPRKSLAEILSRYVVTPAGCWEWAGFRNRDGYGEVCTTVAGKPTVISAPRLQWMRLKGKPRPGLVICHRCDNRACINIDHLFQATQRANIHDMIAKGRHDHTGLRNHKG